MRIIDFHTHVYPETIANKAAQSVRVFYDIPGQSLDGTVSTLLTHGAQAGIDHYVVLPVALTPERTRHINDYAISQAAQHPEFSCFGTLHAGLSDIESEVQYIFDHNLKGIKLHPDSQKFCIDDPRLFPAYEMVQGKLPMVFHVGDPRYDYSRPERLRKVMDLFPNLQVLAAHFGGYRMHDIAVDCFRNKENCFFDISSSMMFMEPGTAERLINLYGAERFVYGTDYPMWDPVQEVSRFLSLKLHERQIEQIAHLTAEHILQIG